MENREPQVGDWCVIGAISDWHPKVATFAAGEITRVTPKLVYANAHYRSQHPRENVTVMPCEEAAVAFVEASKGHYAESKRREQAAWAAYGKAIHKMFAALHPKETPHGE